MEGVGEKDALCGVHGCESFYTKQRAEGVGRGDERGRTTSALARRWMIPSVGA